MGNLEQRLTHNRATETIHVIEELVTMAKEFAAAAKAIDLVSQQAETLSEDWVS